MLTSELIKVLEAKLKKDGDLPVYRQRDAQTLLEDKNIFTCCSKSETSYPFKYFPRRIVIV